MAEYKKITKAVIPAAGLGTRMLPISKSVPKEVLPIVDRPAISYLVEEAAKSGVTDVLIITSRDKDAIENYFDRSPEYEYKLKAANRQKDLDLISHTDFGVRIHYFRQREANGLGQAIAYAETFCAGDSFFVLYGDDVIISETPVCAQLETAYRKHGLATAGVGRVSDELVCKYCTLDAKELGDGYYRVTNMIEKPKLEEIITNFSVLGRVILTPEIFDILRVLPIGAGGELQLTDAMGMLSRSSGMTAVEFEGKRFDLGSKLGLMMANVTQALVHPDIGDEFREFLKTVL
jgi:UDP-glucose pyrophosphorylase